MLLASINHIMTQKHNFVRYLFYKIEKLNMSVMPLPRFQIEENLSHLLLSFLFPCMLFPYGYE